MGITFFAIPVLGASGVVRYFVRLLIMESAPRACACRHFILRLGGPVRRGFYALFPRATEADGAGIAQVRNQPVETTAWLRMQSAAKRSRRPLSLQFAICREIFRNCRESQFMAMKFNNDFNML